MPVPPLWAGYARAIVGGLSDPKIYQKSRDNLMQNSQEVQLAVDVLRAALPASAAGEAPLLGLVLGTGLSGLAAELLTGSPNGPAAGGASCVRVPFVNLPGFPLPGVDSHQGAFVRGRLNGVPVLAQQGRCHFREPSHDKLSSFPFCRSDIGSIRASTTVRASVYSPEQVAIARNCAPSGSSSSAWRACASI